MIVVVGSVNMDLVVKVDRHPVPGETLLSPRYDTHRGGKGANQAVAASRAGAGVSFVGAVGGDAFGEDLRQGLEENSVDHVHLRTCDAPTGVAFIAVDQHGQNTIIVAAGANSAVVPDYIDPAVFSSAKLVLLQLEIPVATAGEVARMAHERGAQVVLNYAPAISPEGFVFDDIDYLIVNETEAGVLLGREGADATQNPEATVRELTRFVPNVVLTLGADGVAWASDGGRESGRRSSLKVEAVDTTGAGDAFVGALAARLSHGDALREAIDYAVVAGGLAVTKAGAQPSLPWAQDITVACRNLE